MCVPLCNAQLHSRFLACAVLCYMQNAPLVLDAATHATTAVRLWVHALAGHGGRQCAFYLTEVLALHRHVQDTQLSTALLFAGITKQKVGANVELSLCVCAQIQYR